LRFTAKDARDAMLFVEEFNNGVVQILRPLCDDNIQAAAHDRKNQAQFTVPPSMLGVEEYTRRDVVIALGNQLFEDGYSVSCHPDTGVIDISWTLKKDLQLERHKKFDVTKSHDKKKKKSQIALLNMNKF